MDHDGVLRAWLLEAVAALGGTGTPLDVSRHVWTRRSAELEAAGDLLYVWQVELRATARSVADDGALVLAGGDPETWSLPGADHRAAPRPTGRWDDDEIAVAVDAYVTMLRASHAGRPLRRAEALALVRDRTGRSAAALEAMFSNISAVVQEMGIEPLPAHPPRSNVPVGVRPAVRAALGD